MTTQTERVRSALTVLYTWRGVDVRTLLIAVNYIVQEARRSDRPEGSALVEFAIDLLDDAWAVKWPRGLPDEPIYWARDKAGRMLVSPSLFGAVTLAQA